MQECSQKITANDELLLYIARKLVESLHIKLQQCSQEARMGGDFMCRLDETLSRSDLLTIAPSIDKSKSLIAQKCYELLSTEIRKTHNNIHLVLEQTHENDFQPTLVLHRTNPASS